jgi:two-component system NtrC family sensor kinase
MQLKYRRRWLVETARGALSSLTVQLFGLLFAVIAVAFGVYALISVQTIGDNYQRTVHESVERFSNLIQRSTHYGMLLNRKEDVHEIIRAIAAEPGVEGVRVYDKQGVIIFSARPSDIGHQVDLQAEACVSCHDSDTPLVSVPVDNRARIFVGPTGNRVLGLINPIENSAECYNAACHAHSPNQNVLGVLDVTMSMAQTDRRLATVKSQTMVAAGVITLLAGLLSAAFILSMVRKPVKQLIAGAERVANGNLDTEITVHNRNEVGQLAVAFNNMTRDLRGAQQELTTWSDRLEVKLQEKTDELSRTQRQVAHMDKMASLGKLAATVAHELNNPLAGILNYAKLVERKLAEGSSIPESEELGRYLSLIQKEASRTGAIVRGLLAFARPSGAAMTLHSLNTIIERSVMLVHHHIEMANIQLDAEPIDCDDHVLCDGDQLQQAMVALLVNAVEAMPNGGTLRISGRCGEDSIQLCVADTGLGIPEEAIPHIFEPFFSSKEKGTGVGLGLAVVYGIVRHHSGQIEVDSAVDQGTTFRITLPRDPTRNESATVAASSRQPPENSDSVGR